MTAEHRRRLREEYGDVYDRVAATLFEHDPIGINFESNSDEYHPEVGTILPRLRSAQSVEDVRRIVHEEFVRWFDQPTAGPESRYEIVGREIWSVWQGSSLGQRSPK